MPSSKRSHLVGSCKAAPGRCYNRNRPHAPAHPSIRALLLSLLCGLLVAMPSSCLAQTSDATTLPPEDIAEVTTAYPPQQPALVPEVELKSTTVAAVDAIVSPEESSAAEVADEVVQSSLVALGGEGLEQGIRNAVKSEVESEVEADPSAFGIVQVTHVESEQQSSNHAEEQTDAAQVAREPKTLEANVEVEPQQVEQVVKVEEPAKPEPVAEPQEETAAETVSEPEKEEAVASDKQPAEPESEQSNQSENTIGSDQIEAGSKPLPSVTSDLVAVIFDENRAITEQPITKTNILALEKEHEDFNDVVAKQESTFESPKHQVTKKQGVEDLLPVEPAKTSVETEEESRPAPEVEETAAVEPQPAAHPTEEDEKPSETSEEPVQSSESAQSGEASNAAQPESAQSESVESDESGKPVQSVEPVQPGQSVQPVQSVESVQAVVPAASGSSEQSEESVEAAQEVKPVESEQSVDVKKEENDDELVQGASSTVEPEPVASTEPSVEETEVESEQSSDDAKDQERKQSEVSPEVVHSNVATAKPNSEPVQSIESSSTTSPVEPETEKNDESVEEESNEESDGEETRPKKVQITVNAEHKDSSEESEEQSGEEPKARAEDSTATPLVSYPPHNAGQTFDSNLADERSAHLSLASTNRSTLIIALCSGTAVLFIVVSLVIFVLSFQRQHGTLDIEMQEQRLGKDDLDQEDAQMKLLDVELSSPVIIAMGNEETDECL